MKSHCIKKTKIFATRRIQDIPLRIDLIIGSMNLIDSDIYQKQD